LWLRYLDAKSPINKKALDKSRAFFMLLDQLFQRVNVLR
jgi:hypothetical protein